MHSLCQITDILEDIMSDIGIKYCASAKCSTAGTCLASFMTQLAAQQLWPNRKRETQALDKLVTALGSFEWDASSIERFSHGGYTPCSAFSSADSINTGLHTKVKNVQSQIKAPCLSCVQEGNIGAENACKHKHEAVSV